MLDLPNKKHEEHENHERWLVSYADFITLLFAFFVVMYASSNNNPAKMKELEEAIRNQMNLDHAGSSSIYESNAPISKSLIKNPAKPKNKEAIDELAGNVGDPALETIKHEMQRNKELEAAAAADRFQKNMQLISEALKEEIEAHKVFLQSENQTITLSVDTRISFENGLARVKGDFDGILQKIANVLDQVNGKIKISGHSGDDRLPASSVYQNLLELSSARATQFASSLIQRSKTLETRVGVESFGGSSSGGNSGSVYDSLPKGRIEITVYQK